MPASKNLTTTITRRHERLRSACLTALLCCGASHSWAVDLPTVTLALDHGSPRLEVHGSAGQWVQVEYRSALEPPGTWSPLTNTLLVTDSLSFVDTSAASEQLRFYRVSGADQPPIPAGTFLMGSPMTEVGRDSDEGPQTEVTLTSYFWIGTHEVTQREYLAVMGSNPSAATGNLDRPVEQVSWSDAQSYCSKLTQLEQSAGRISAGYNYRLPTEAEWEYAARAGSTSRFAFGTDPSYAQLGDYAWYIDNSDGSTHPVDTKLPNAWNLYDMEGNVWEWCQDWYGSYSGGSQTDPKGPASGSSRVARGGSYYYDGWLCRSAARNSFPPATRKGQLGFRVVLAPQ